MTTTITAQDNQRAEELMQMGFKLLLSEEEKDFMLESFKGDFWDGNYHIGEPDVSKISGNVYYWIHFDIKLAGRIRFLTEIFSLGYKLGKNVINKYK